MAAKKLGLLLVLGMIIGMSLAACASVGSAPSEVVGAPSLISPWFDTLALPELRLVPSQPMLLKSLSAARAEQAAQMSQTLWQAGHGGCSGGDGMFSQYANDDD